jgi:hypothetical protein
LGSVVISAPNILGSVVISARVDSEDATGGGSGGDEGRQPENCCGGGGGDWRMPTWNKWDFQTGHSKFNRGFNTVL